MKKAKVRRKIKKEKKRQGHYPWTLIFLLSLCLLLSLFILSQWPEKLRPQEKSGAFSATYASQSTSAETEIEQRPRLGHQDSTDSIVKPQADSTSMGSEDNLPAKDPYYFTRSFDFAWPAYTSTEQIIEREYFTLSYDEEHEQALWVSYTLSAERLAKPIAKRKNRFRSDPLVLTESAHPNDYRGSGFDRGHLAPAGDFVFSQEAMDQSFFMSNISPQDPSLNRGIWKRLEDQVRKWAERDGKLYIVTGPILSDGCQRIGENEVGIPDYFYKIVLDLEEPELKGIGFVFHNTGSSDPLTNFAVSIDSLEALTGLDFFPSLPAALEKKVEGTMNLNQWF